MQRWHVDLVVVNNCGPYRYGMTITDEYSGFAMFTPLTSKSAAFEKFKETWLMMEKQTGRELEEVQSDQGGEFINVPMEEWLKRNGIKRRKTVAYSHEQNGPAERSNRTTLEKARSILASTNLPKELWPEAMRFATVARNRSWNATQNMTPWEAFWGTKPEITHLRIFGCDAWVHVEKKDRKKLEPKSELYKMVGYGNSEGMKAYYVWNPRMEDLRDTRKYEKALKICGCTKCGV